MKIGFRTFLLFSINYIVGFGFIQTTNKIINIGWAGSLVIVAGALIAFSVALVFARGAKNFDETGGSYVYAKKAFGKKMTFFQGWNQYIQSPLAGAAAPLFLYSILKDYWTQDWGQEKWSLMVLSFALFALIILSTFMGFKKSSKFILVAASVKWIILFLTFGAAIYMFATNSYFVENMTTMNVSTAGFVGALISFFYAFGGIEGIAAMTTDVKDGKKNTTKIILINFIFATAFYAIFYLVLVGALHNVNENATKHVLKATFGITGVVLFVIAMIFNKFSSAPGSTIANSRSLAPMAEDNLLPKWIGTKNKNGEYKNAIIFDTILRFIFMFGFMIIPMFLNSEMDFTTIIDIWTLVIFIQYTFTFITMLVLEKQGKITKIPAWERIAYVIGSILMIAALVVYLIPPVVGTSFGTSFNSDYSYIVIIIQVGSYALSMLAGYGLMYWAQKKKQVIA